MREMTLNFDVLWVLIRSCGKICIFGLLQIKKYLTI